MKPICGEIQQPYIPNLEIMRTEWKHSFC